MLIRAGELTGEEGCHMNEAGDAGRPCKAFKSSVKIWDYILVETWSLWKTFTQECQSEVHPSGCSMWNKQGGGGDVRGQLRPTLTKEFILKTFPQHSPPKIGFTYSKYPMPVASYNLLSELKDRRCQAWEGEARWIKTWWDWVEGSRMFP